VSNSTQREREGGHLLGRTKTKIPTGWVWAVVAAAADLLATRWERAGKVVLAGVCRPSGVSNSGGQEEVERVGAVGRWWRRVDLQDLGI
jgi:hypothetical protein